ncbi:MAG: SDR family oxidoreductase [Pseudobacteriovorax sp.]|nr:SDR family oxidoreductase [Pseudobacteriovorax sp.]
MPKPIMCDPKLFQKSLDGLVYIVTGSNSGIGLVTAKQLAKQGASVVMACRRVAEADKAIAEAANEGLSSSLLKTMYLDLGDLESVRNFCQEFVSSYDRLDGLVNNAGVMNTPFQKTKDGFEMQIGINHLGHFLLTDLLLDRLKQTQGSRIVNVSSCYHDKAMGKSGFIDFDDIHFATRKYDGWTSYAQSKLANVLHAKELARQLKGTGVTAVSLHPGWVRTNLIRHSMPTWLQDTLLKPILRLVGMIEPWEGAQTTLHCLLDDSIPQHSGAFFSQLGIYSDKSFNKGGWPMTSPSKQANDDDIAKRFWAFSESQVGLT